MKADILSPLSPKGKAQVSNNFTMLHHHLLPPSFLSGHITKDNTSSTYCSVFSNSSRLSGHKLHPMKGDGNCMFQCFSHYLLGMEEEHNAVRTLIIQFNCHYFEPLLMSNNKPTLKVHVSKMCRTFTWVTQIEMEAVACLFQVPDYECVQSQDGETCTTGKYIMPEHQLISFAFLLL